LRDHGDVRKLAGTLGSALLLGLVGCTGPEQSGQQPLNTDPVTNEGPEICSVVPKQALAHMTARTEDSLTAVGELAFGPDVDRGQCEILVSEAGGRQTVASLRIDSDQAGAAVRVNAAIQVARERSARAPLPNPLQTGTEVTPSISLAIMCDSRPVQIGLDIAGYDSRRKTVDADLAALIGVIAAKYGDKARCRPTTAPPLAEEQRGAVRVMAGNGGLDLPGAPASGPSTSIGHIEALTAVTDGTVYMVSRKYPADTNPRNADDSTAPWGQTLRILRVRTDGVVEVAWDPNLAPFSTSLDPVAGDIPEKLRLQGRDTLGSVSAIVLHGDQAWLVPTSTESKQDTDSGTLARPVRIVQLTGARAVDLRAIKAPLEADTSRIRDQNGRLVPDPMGIWNAARFSAVSFDGDTPVLLDSAHGQMWRVEGIRDGKILDTTVFSVGTELAPGSSVAGLNGGRFAVSTPQGGLSIVDSRGRVTLAIPAVSAEIDGVAPGPVELGRRQLAGAGDDVLVHAMASQVAAPAVVRLDSRTGATRTVQVSGYPGLRDSTSDVENTRFSRAYGTAANATMLFATGWPVSALGAVGQKILLAPFGTRILYELAPRK
jgi:hypothetical protein